MQASAGCSRKQDCGQRKEDLEWKTKEKEATEGEVVGSTGCWADWLIVRREFARPEQSWSSMDNSGGTVQRGLQDRLAEEESWWEAALSE